MKHFYSVAKIYLPKSLIIFFLIAGVLLWTGTMIPSVSAYKQLNYPQNYPNISWANAPQAYSNANNGYTLQDVVIILGQIRDFVLIAGIIFVLIFLIWGGIAYMTSGGDSTKVAAAKNRIVAAIIGAAIVVGAFLILQTIKTIIEKKNLIG